MSNFVFSAGGFSSISADERNLYLSAPLFDPNADQTDLIKSMSAGVPTPTYSGGGLAAPLLRQDLGDTLYMQALGMKQVKLFPRIYKNRKSMMNSVFEYTKKLSNGSPFIGVFNGEGSAGSVVDSEYERVVDKMRWIVEKRQATLQVNAMTNTLALADSMVEEQSNSAHQHIMMQLEYATFHGDSTVDSNAFDGLRKMLASRPGQVINRRGSSLSIDDLGEYQRIGYEAVNGNALPDIMYTSPEVSQALAVQYGDKIRPIYNAGQAIPGVAGAPLPSFVTAMGSVTPDYSLFLAPMMKKLTHTSATATTAPVAPTTVTCTVAADATNSQFRTADAGTLTWKVCAIGKVDYEGASPATATTATAIAAGEKNTLSISAPSVDNVKYYNVYRNRADNLTEWYLIGQVAQAYSSGSPTTTTFVDYNEEIPGTSSACLLDLSGNNLNWREALPYSRIALPLAGLIQPFAFMMWGTLYAPVPGHIWIKNIGV